MSRYQLAQLNIAKMKFALEDPGMAEFVARLEEINALADASPGFVWRLQTADGDATAIDYFGSETLVNLSVWEDLDSLRAYVYRSAHNEVMARRRQWFERSQDAYSVLWWIDAGHIPTLYEASEKLDWLRRKGATVRAFSFKQSFAPK
ncbi:MAG: DUF3291 domain-containing protein [Gammaproteobacteria bacterium]|nr:DUF3291 domain-containing protein [Gammaproteobacteria bacterium]